MASKTIVSKQITTPEFRVGFPNVWKPNDKGKFGLVMLFDKQTATQATFAPFQEIIKEVLAEVQTVIYRGQPIPPSVRTNPIKDGDIPNSNNNVFFAGYYSAGTTSNFQPGIVDANVQPILDQSEFYAGCYARAKVHAYWYEKDGNKGVGLSIGNIQKVRDGERLGGGRPATEDFDAIDQQYANAETPVADINSIMNI